MNHLRSAGILRTSNNPVSDYGEYIVSKKLKLNLTPNSNKSIDAIDPKNKLGYQIKSRRITRFSQRRQFGVIRSFKFDFLIAILFKENFEVMEAYKIPSKTVKKYTRFSRLQNGHIFIMNKDILKDRNVEEIKL